MFLPYHPNKKAKISLPDLAGYPRRTYRHSAPYHHPGIIQYACRTGMTTAGIRRTPMTSSTIDTKRLLFHFDFAATDEAIKTNVESGP